MHSAALLELRANAGSRPLLLRAITLQERAQQMSPRDPVLLNDLAVMYLELGSRDQELITMLRALDTVERALALDPALGPALYNRALILDRLYLVGIAQRAWERYRQAERRPAWRREAAAHLRRLQAAPRSVTWPSVQRSASLAPGEIAARVARMPSAAREFSFRLLGEWGRSVLHGNEPEARRLLALARTMAAAADSVGADRSLALALETIDGAAGDPARTRALARAHADFGAGFGLYFAPAYEQAASALATAERALRSQGSPAARWAAFYQGAAEMNLGRFARADSLYRRVIREATGDEPALLGKAVWVRGVNQVRQGNYELAASHYRDAAAHLRRAREPESEAAIAYLLSEALLRAGQTTAARAEEYRGLRLLSPFRNSGFLNNHLTIVTLDARDAGLPHAALAVMDEVVEVAQSVAKPDVLAWAFQARAREYHALGRAALARADLARAASWADSILPGRGRDRIEADIKLVRGLMLRDADPGTAVDTLSDVARQFRTVAIGMNLPSALFEAAQAAEAAGNPALARRHLEAAIRELERQQASYQSAELRATRAETVEHVFDAMIRLELRAGRPASALEYLERSRMTAWTRDARPEAAAAGPGPALPARVSRLLPDDMLLLDYALLEDRVVVWSVSRRGWRHHVVHVRRDSVAALVSRFQAQAPRAGVRPGDARADLFDLLLRPVTDELRQARRLAVIPDRELFQLPFAALWDRTTSAYVVERFEVRTLPNAGLLLAGGGEPRLAGRSPALVVGNPRVDPRLAQALPGLPGAAREAAQVAEMYGTSRLLAGGDAREDAVLAHLPRYSVFHFAGHAVFNSEQPELSYLALAPGAGSGDGILQAREIGRLRLPHLRVVILSACRTLNPRPSRAGGNAGLAYSFLRAGVPGTVSTVRDVEDGPAVAVLAEFHRALAQGTPPAEALRLAQLATLRSAHAEMRAPAVWAAFVYTGS